MTLIARIKAAQEAFQKEAQEELGKSFKKFFEDHPEVASVQWEQYTPYFNDGETCYFGVRELEAKDADGEDAFAYFKETEEQYKYLEGGYVSMPALRSATDAEEALERDFGGLSSLVEGLEDLLEGIFGDHATVTATASGFEVDECEHD